MVGAVACWEDGVAEPAEVARELVRRAAAGGVEVREGVDARELERDVLVIAGASLAIVFVGKAAASYVAGRLAGFNRSEIRLVFGLTIAQAAATLAAVTIGVSIGLFNEELLSAALVVVLVTVVVGSIITRTAARSLEPELPATVTDRPG